ncbi:hypothetical protein V6N12_069508 [Hibiscus sabdariffa]|uniref:Uncharacterized protein n=1 Tax=Hibiscus sabdariffa TaxID=183260 RepID=A0ABR2FE24_9ROSI
MATSELLTSSGNTFELGFFSTGSTDLYLAICMKNVPTKDIVWVANRDLAFSGSSVILTINGDGNLVIVDGRATYRVSDGGPPSSQNLSATLLESGNLVLRNGSSDLLWQSFDYPLNTFLPGMKLGYNNKTGKVWSLTSWLDQQDPNKGDFELKMDPSKSNGVLLMREKQQDHYGCMRNMPIKCGNGDNKDGFLKMDNVKYPLSLTQQTNPSNLFPSGPQVLISDAITCQESCLNNCSCSAYAYNTSGHCLRWYGDILGLEQLSAKDPNGGTIFIKLAASEFDNGRGANKYLWIIVIPIVLLVFLPASFIVFQRRKSLKNQGEIDDTSQDILLFDVEMSITTSSREFSGSENSGKQKRKDSACPLFNFASVSAATNNFSLENKLGEGGFGPVYKAWELWEGDRGVELMDPKLEDQVSYPMLLRSATNNSNQPSSKPATFSVNNITVSLMEPR